jgi:hypothetical protein
VVVRRERGKREQRKKKEEEEEEGLGPNWYKNKAPTLLAPYCI